jgi:hypothetical protein
LIVDGERMNERKKERKKTIDQTGDGDRQNDDIKKAQ